MINILLSQYNFHEKWARDHIQKYLNEDQNVLIIPFSFGDKINSNELWQKAYNKNFGKYYEAVVMPFASYGIKEDNINWINYFTDSIEKAKEKIKCSDVLFFTGGYPDKMMERLKEFNLINVFEKYEGVMMGSSAGALIQLKDYHLTPDDDYHQFGYYQGLNIITDFYIEVHYHGSDIQNEYINKVLNEKTDVVYGIKDTGGIIVHNNQVELMGDVVTFNKIIVRA